MKPRIQSYYFGFDATGVPEVDDILSAVTYAGRMFHHTESWGDELAPGKTCESVIQDAANEAARVWRLREGTDG